MSISSPRVVESLLLNNLYYFQRFFLSQKPGNLFSSIHLNYNQSQCGLIAVYRSTHHQLGLMCFGSF